MINRETNITLQFFYEIEKIKKIMRKKHQQPYMDEVMLYKLLQYCNRPEPSMMKPK